MIAVSEVIIVEGRYDKNTLSQVFDAVILETLGFGIYSNRQRLSLFRRLAKSRGIVVFTDSDGAGFQIRNFLKGAIKEGRVLHAFVPDIKGREKRKSSPSKEGKLGVEGMKPQVLIDALLRSGATLTGAEDSPAAGTENNSGRISKTDLYMLKLTGGAGSKLRRDALLKKLELPERLSTNSMLDVLNAITDRDELIGLVQSLQDNII